MADAPGPEDDLKDEVRRLSARIAELEGMLSQLREPFGQLQDIGRNYFRLIELYMRFGEVSPTAAVPGLKDPMSRDIVNALFQRGGQNISELTEAVRQKRGSASRRIIRQRLSELEGQGVVRGERKKKTVEYHVSDDVVRKWSQMLGFVNRGDRP
jgi:DNA-binding transcriptional ArsR family regulator